MIAAKYCLGVLLLLCGTIALSEEPKDLTPDESLSEERTLYRFGLEAGLNAFAILTAPGGHTGNRPAFFAGVRVYRNTWQNPWGIFGALTWQSRGSSSVGGQVYRAQFLDLTLGPSLQHGALLASDTSTVTYFGPTVFLPLGDLSYEGGTIQTARPSFGFSLASGTKFHLIDNFPLEIILTLRGALTRVFDPSGLGRLERILEAGVSIAYFF